MRSVSLLRHRITRTAAALGWLLTFTVGASAVATGAAAQVLVNADPRVGLKAGLQDAGEASKNVSLIGHAAKPEGFFDPTGTGKGAYSNSDLAFSGNYAFQGNYNGWQVWDLANPAGPKLRASLICPGGQGDPSVWGNLLFISVESTSGRVDCGTQGVKDTVSAERFRGVRIFDISDLDHPKQIAAIQTCRGSHTHTLLPDEYDKDVMYVYVSGTGVTRSPNELKGCSGRRPEDDPNTSLFRIDIIKVNLSHPQDAKIINSPRIFVDDSTGKWAGLWKGGDHGEGTQKTNETNQCHDITIYPAKHIAAGACSGNGIVLDVTNPANPKRVAEASDPNFAYWHSATFNDAGDKVLFSDEWGGGGQARCKNTDPTKWGADVIYYFKDGKLTQAGFYKMSAPQSPEENCVAHNGSLIPIPGRDVMVQAWYQGGLSLMDFTDARNATEIAFFDRGPVNGDKLVGGGYWSAYWYNGHIIGSEIARGFDILDLKAGPELSQNEIDAAKLVHMDWFNPQSQPKFVWPPAFVLSRAYLDQLTRDNGLTKPQIARVAAALKSAEAMKGGAQKTALSKLAAEIEKMKAGSSDAAKVGLLAQSVTQLAGVSA